MALNSTKPHIGFFGRTNCGKSSLINRISRQSISIVSEKEGTTTDAVSKAIELGSAGPVVLLDTAGIADQTELGKKRIDATMNAIKKVDLAILVISNNLFDHNEKDLIKKFMELNTPFLIVYNKEDLEKITKKTKEDIKKSASCDLCSFSCPQSDDQKIDALINLISENIPSSAYNNPSILGDLVKYGSHVLLVTPIDSEAPKGRMILPQVQAIRDALDNDCIVTVLKERELDIFFKEGYKKPDLVVTDSQVFLKVDGSVPADIPMTSFSILFARLKGDFEKYIEGAKKLSHLKDGDNILILESCSHHVTGDDIGRVKIPRWISNFSGKKISYDVVASFNSLPKKMNEYSLVIQCGGCMLTRKQVINKLQPAIDRGIPVTNYGMAIAYTLGIFERALKPFGIEKQKTRL